MKIVKKILGSVLLLLAVLLAIGTFLNFVSVIFIRSLREFQESTATGIGYLFAAIFFTFLLVLLIRFKIKSSLKLLHQKKLQDDSIDDIGKL